MTLSFILQNSASLDPLSFLLPLDVFDSFLFPIFALKFPAIIVIYVDILSITLHTLFRLLYIFCILPKKFSTLSEVGIRNSLVFRIY